MWQGLNTPSLKYRYHVNIYYMYTIFKMLKRGMRNKAGVEVLHVFFLRFNLSTYVIFVLCTYSTGNQNVMKLVIISVMVVSISQSILLWLYPYPNQLSYDCIHIPISFLWLYPYPNQLWFDYIHIPIKQTVSKDIHWTIGSIVQRLVTSFKMTGN